MEVHRRALRPDKYLCFEHGCCAMGGPVRHTATHSAIRFGWWNSGWAEHQCVRCTRIFDVKRCSMWDPSY